jgi:hypothetical protein
MGYLGVSRRKREVRVRPPTLIWSRIILTKQPGLTVKILADSVGNTSIGTQGNTLPTCCTHNLSRL